MNRTKVISYKGFSKDLKGRGFQYEVGKDYEISGKVIPHVNGFHACEDPFDILSYRYDDLSKNRFCKVEQSGEIYPENEVTISSKIKVIKEIGWKGLFLHGIEWLRKNHTIYKESDGEIITSTDDYARIFACGELVRINSSGDMVKIGSTGYATEICSYGKGACIALSGSNAIVMSLGKEAKIGSLGHYAIINTEGDGSQIASSGNCARLYASGDYSTIISKGKYADIVCSGYESCVKAKIGSRITLSEFSKDEDRKIKPYPIHIKTAYVDGSQIKADTLYKLVDGEFTKVIDK